MLPQFI